MTTIEIDLDTLENLAAAAREHGAAVLSAKSTAGVPIWLKAVHRKPGRPRKRREGTAAALPQLGAQPLPLEAQRQQAGQQLKHEHGLPADGGAVRFPVP